MENIHKKTISRLYKGMQNEEIVFNDENKVEASLEKSFENNKMYYFFHKGKYVNILDYIISIDNYRNRLVDEGYNIATLYFDEEMDRLLHYIRLLEFESDKEKIKNITKVIDYCINNLNIRYTEANLKTVEFKRNYNSLYEEASIYYPAIIGYNDSKLKLYEEINNKIMIIGFEKDQEAILNPDDLICDGWTYSSPKKKALKM